MLVVDVLCVVGLWLEIVFDDVCFVYLGCCVDVYVVLSFLVCEGEMVVIVGLSGVGKLIIVCLLLC